jgi:hypothetical protein
MSEKSSFGHLLEEGLRDQAPSIAGTCSDLEGERSLDSAGHEQRAPECLVSGS